MTLLRLSQKAVSFTLSPKEKTGVGVLPGNPNSPHEQVLLPFPVLDCQRIRLIGKPAEQLFGDNIVPLAIRVIDL